jgi:osmotically-inducible protein OsmY
MSSIKRVFGVLLVFGFLTASMLVANARAQTNDPEAPRGSTVTTEQSKHVEHESVQTSSEHKYNSPAERANDDLLITEVKSSLAEQGITPRYPVEVDCDHGTIRLAGVVGSAAQAREAEQIAAQTNGVVGVKNQLTWR